MKGGLVLPTEEEKLARKVKISFTLEELELIWDACGNFPFSQHGLEVMNGAMEKMKKGIEALNV